MNTVRIIRTCFENDEHNNVGKEHVQLKKNENQKNIKIKVKSTKYIYNY